MSLRCNSSSVFERRMMLAFCQTESNLVDEESVIEDV